MRETDGKEPSLFPEEALPPPTREVLRRIGSLAAASDVRAYLVGGVVRDLLLGREARDLDVVIEGDACGLAREIASALGTTARIHDAFQTAAILLPGGARLDLAAARTESYRAPAALPEVEPTWIRQDLLRRDFTINALAVPLTPTGLGKVVDLFGGREDLRDGKIRVLHDLSFIDDPTRAFRAVRFASDLGFEISDETSHLIRAATGERAFERLSAARLRREIEQLLGGRRPVTAVRMMVEHHLLTVLHPRLTPSRRTYAQLRDAEEALSWHRLSCSEEGLAGWTVVLSVLTQDLDDDSRGEILDRLRLGRAGSRIVRDAGASVPRILGSLTERRELLPSLLVEVCRNEPTEIVVLAMALCGREDRRRALARYLSHLRHVRPDITGSDLIRAGVPEGPKVAAGLDAALRAKLDGRASDAGSQLQVALAALGEA